jgi:hypothetical protein
MAGDANLVEEFVQLVDYGGDLLLQIACVHGFRGVNNQRRVPSLSMRSQICISSCD